MNKNKKIDNYYNKLLEYRNSFLLLPRAHSLSSNNYSTKKVIESIVNNNNDYLLTNSYLYFLAVTSISQFESFTKVLYEKLNNLSKDKELIIKELFSYLDSYHTYCIHRTSHDNYTLGFDLTVNLRKLSTALEDDLNYLYNHYMIRVEADNSLSSVEYNISKVILNIYACLSLYDQSSTEFEDLSIPFLDNTKSRLEELKMNGLFMKNYDDRPLYNLDNMINYFVNTPVDKNKKLIR